ncbi:ribosomal protein L31e-domain-containing protein [Pelagophyceae sp. CCMP2097]|nr:ribosomal protein L31e-domain-containing protein [Pelagophyceae sp. CCMP2097]
MPKESSAPRAKTQDLVTRDYTVNLHKRLHGITFKKKAPRAIRELKKFAQSVMQTTDVRVDAKLNKFIWSQGVRNVPGRVRVRLSRKRNEDEEATEKLYTLIQHVEVASVKGLQTEVVNDA